MRKRLNFFTVSRFTLTSMSILLALLFFLISNLHAGKIEQNFREYLKTLSPDEFVSAIVIMADQADIKSLKATLKAEKATRKRRHQEVISTLQVAASKSQGEIVSYLDAKKSEGSVKGYTPYWIMNLIVVQATIEEMERIAARQDVEIVEPNFKVSLIEPVGNKTREVKAPKKGIGVTPGLKAINVESV